eukprot:1153234-Pelagomonas_calceolata.AAC.1
MPRSHLKGDKVPKASNHKLEAGGGGANGGPGGNNNKKGVWPGILSWHTACSFSDKGTWNYCVYGRGFPHVAKSRACMLASLWGGGWLVVDWVGT